MFRAKKSLGQNFLSHPAILGRIAGAVRLSLRDTVVEVGAGTGNLTKELLNRAGKVIAVEKDNRLIPLLRQKFSSEISSGRLELVHGDILDFSLSRYAPDVSRYSIVANLPYYITGAFFKKFLEVEKNCPAAMVLLLQKEVARRIVASDKKESVLSISVKAYGEPRITEILKAALFSPRPKVDSAALILERISRDFFKDFSEEHFFSILRQGFAHKRKLLLRNLEPLYPSVRGAFMTCGLSEKIRAENLSVEMWGKLARNLDARPLKKHQ